MAMAPLPVRIIDKSLVSDRDHHRHHRQQICRPLPALSSERHPAARRRHRHQPGDDVRLGNDGR